MSPLNPPVVQAQMIIRKPASEVYEAFVNPVITTRFWFTHASGPLVVGKKVRWEWAMYGVGTDVTVKALEPDSRILIEWDEPPTPVEWTFESLDDESTLVKIACSGFRGTDEEIIAQALDSKGGFSYVLAGLKAWLEHGINLNLVRDHLPAGQHESHGST